MSLCTFVSSVLLWFSVRERLLDTRSWDFFLSRWEGFSLTERTEFTEPFGAHFELTEGLWHTDFTEAFQLTLALTLCDIGWLNVSVECCVFCSSVFFCEKENAPSLWDNIRATCRGVLSLTKDFSFSHRAHGGHGGFKRTVSSPQNASGIQNSQSVTAKDGCKVLWYLPAARPLWNAVCSVLLC